MAAGLNLHTTDNLNENWGGRGEKWLQADEFSALFGGSRWHYILPNGEVYRWDGSASASGELVTVLDPSYHQDLGKLTQARQWVEAHVVGMDVEAARQMLEAHQLDLQVSRRDGENLWVTADLRSHRLNVGVESGKIVSTHGWS